MDESPDETTQLIASMRQHFLLTLSSIRQEVGNALGPVSGFTDVLAMNTDDNLTARQFEYLDRIKDGAQNLKRLMHQLHNLMLWYGDGAVGDPQEFDLNEAVKETFKLVKHSYRLSDETARIDLSPGTLPVMANEWNLKLALEALMIKAIGPPPFEGSLRVRLGRYGDNARVDFSFHGSYSTATCPSLGENNDYWKELTWTIDSAANGLGLRLIDLIIEESGGKLVIEGATDSETVMWFALPVRIHT